MSEMDPCEWCEQVLQPYLDRELDEATCFRRHGGFTQLQRVHFTQAFETRDHRFCSRILRRDAIKNALSLILIECVVDLLAHIDSE